MVSDDFNPYHEWLGLDRELKQPNYYQLLGIEPSETNTLKISTAADRVAARVRSIRPGPRAREWAKVLDEITSAKNCLLDPTRRAQYDRQLAAARFGGTGGYRRPAPRDKTTTTQPTAGQPNAYPSNVPMSAPLATPVQPWATPMPAAPAPMANPVKPNLPTAIPIGAGHGAATSTPVPTGPAVQTVSERTASRMARKRAKRSRQLPLLAVGLGGAILLLAIVLLAVVGGGGNRDRDGQDRKHVSHNRPIARSPIAIPRPAGGPSKSPGAIEPGSRQPTESETLPANHGTLMPKKAMELPQTPSAESPPESTSIPSEPQPKETPKSPVAEPPDSSMTAPEPKADLPPAADHQPKPAPQPATRPTAAQVGALATALKSARTKLERHDFDGASAEIEKVTSLPKLPEHQAKYERLRLLTAYATQFRSALMEAIKNLEAGDEIPAGESAAVGVVRATADRITVKIDGVSRTYAIDDLPPGLAIAVADTWLDQKDPASLVAKAAYLASLNEARDDRLAKARQWLREAANGGIDIGDLEKVIDDKYDDLGKDLAP